MKNKERRMILFSLALMAVLLLSACGSRVAAGQAGAIDQPSGGQMPEGTPPAGMAEGAPSGEMPEGTPPAGMPEGVPPEGMSEGSPAGSEPAETPQATATLPAIEISDEVQPDFGMDIAYESVALNIQGVLEVGEKTYIKSHEDISAEDDDLSAAIVTNGGDMTVAYANVETSGDTSSVYNSIVHGQNAAILGEDKSTLKVLYDTVTTSGSGASAVFARDEETQGKAIDVIIDCSGEYGYGILAVEGSIVDLSDIDLTISGDHAAAIATGKDGGTITGESISAVTSGSNTPAIYSTDKIELSNSTISSNSSEAAVVNGAGAIDLSGSDVSDGWEGGRGVLFYRGSSAMDEDGAGTFKMEGGSLAFTAATGSLFSAIDSKGSVKLSGVEVSTASGILARASAGEANQSSSEGGSLEINADGQELAGHLIADHISSISLNLENGSMFSGAIDPQSTAKTARVSMDASSTWNVTRDSYVSILSDPDGISGSDITNITGNGFTVYYNRNANVELKGKIYNLSGGGYLKPLNQLMR